MSSFSGGRHVVDRTHHRETGFAPGTNSSLPLATVAMVLQAKGLLQN